MAHPAPAPRSPGKGRAVRGMFASIAPRYDLLNRLLSAGQDQRWRRAMVDALPPVGAGERVLDLCTGTGDVAVLLAGRLHGGRVHGADFCEAMVARAPAKAESTERRPAFLVADAMALPLPDAAYRAVTVAFGLRNVEDPGAGLDEMGRVLRPGGRLLILEFGRPHNRVFGALYRFYFFRVLPLIGRLLSGSSVDAYRYLPESVWAFDGPDTLGRRMDQAGLRLLRTESFLLGAVRLYVAEKPGP